LRDSRGRVLLPDSGGIPVSSPFPPGGGAFRTAIVRGRSLRIHADRFQYGGLTFDALVAAPLDEVQATMRDLRGLLLLMIPAVLAVACLGGYWVSRRALVPVDEITQAARSMSVQNLSKRLVVPQTGDELQRMSETWNEMLDRLESAVGRIRQFTADASHELRTPLALIRATAELALRRERDPEHYRNSLRQIQVEAESMTGLTEALLAMARADSNGSGTPLAPTDLNAIVTDVVRGYEVLGEQNAVRITARTESGPAVAAVNESAIRRLLVILVDNALKYTPAGGDVEVSVGRSSEGITVAVRDTGTGIQPQHLPHIFERFYRADAARGPASGTGLGLSIAQTIAAAHGTEVGVESTPGGGSRFYVTLRS